MITISKMSRAEAKQQIVISISVREDDDDDDCAELLLLPPFELGVVG